MEILSVHTAELIHAKKVRVCDYEYWIKWARLLSPMHNENARKTSSSSTGLPLKSKSVKTWETEVWRWSCLCNEKPIVDSSTHLTTRWAKQGWIKISETYCSTTVHCGHGQIRQCQRCLTSDSCTSNLTQNPNQCGTSSHNGEVARARPCQCLKMEILSVHTAVLIHAKKFGFVTTSIELNEHDFWARCTVRMQWKQVPVQLDCH